jgi:hypothetical protein
MINQAKRASRHWAGALAHHGLPDPLGNDTLEEAAEAQARGWRTFRVAPAVGWTREKTEALCPASEEAGKLLQCQDCQYCSGLEGKGTRNIVIPNHSTQARAVKRRAGIVFKKNGMVA